MHLLPIKKELWELYAVCDEAGKCELLNFLGNLNKKYEGSKENILAILARVSKDPHGPRNLPDEISHYVDQKEKIFEFIAGDIRLLWFFSGNGKIIICVNAFLKKGQKTPKKLKNKAVQAKTLYLQDHKQNRIHIIEKKAR